MKKINSLLRITALLVFTAVLLGIGMIVPKYLTDRKIQRLSKTNTAVDINEVKPFGIESMHIIQTLQDTLKDLEAYNSLNSNKDGYDMYVKSVGKKKINLDSVKKIMDSMSPHFNGSWEIDGTQLFVPKGRKADNCNLAIVTIKNKNDYEAWRYFDFFLEKKSGIILQTTMALIPEEGGTEYFREIWEECKSDLSEKIEMPMSDRTADDAAFDRYLQDFMAEPLNVNILNKYTAISLDQQLVFKAAAVSLSWADPAETLPPDAAENGQAEAAAKEPDELNMIFIFAIEAI